MGQHDVKGEEDEIRAVLAGTKQTSTTSIRPVAEVAAGDDLAALFAQLFESAGRRPANRDP